LPRWGTLIPIGEGIAAIGCGAGGSIYDLVRVSDWTRSSMPQPIDSSSFNRWRVSARRRLHYQSN